MAKAKNKYSAEADGFGLPPADPTAGMGGMGDMGGGGMGMGGDMGLGGMGGMGGGTPDVSHASNGLFPQDIIPVRGARRLFKLLGISFQPNRPKTQKEKKINLFAYNPDELKYQPGFMRGFLEHNTSPSSLYDYLSSTSLRAAAWERESKSTNILSPEIEAAKDIMVASILSPVDLQTNAINIEVCDKSLPDETQSELTQILSDYINNELKLPKRLSKWIGNALYQTGATPILILPQSNIETLRKLNDLEYAGYINGPGSEIKPTKRPEKAKLVSGETLEVKDAKKYQASFESIKLEAETEDYKAMVEQTVNDCLAGLESLDFIDDKYVKNIGDNRKKFQAEISELIKKSKNYIMFSRDPGSISKHGKDIRSRLMEMQRDIDKEFVINSPTPLYTINSDKSDKKVEAAALVELPYQCVIPVIVPGAPDQHIGYFVLVDQWGEPINPDYRDMNDMNANSRLVESNMHAMFGVPSTILTSERSPIQHFKATSMIFGNILRHFMEHKLEEYGLGGTQIQQHEAVTTCLMRNMLDSRRIGLIFVPEPMMVYYRFNVHQDGTGKSLIEDIRTLTGLRTTLVTSQIMAATENSIDNKIVEMNVGDMNVNAQQLMEQIKNAFTEKRIMRYDNNPLNVQRDLIQKSLTIVPKGIKGLQDGLNITTEHRSTGSIAPDDNLLNQLGDWIIQALKVPKSAVTQIGEENFARSVVTTNLFFNNRVKIIQQDVNEQTTKLIRTYVKYNTILRDKILGVLSTSNKDYRDSNQESESIDAPETPDELDNLKLKDSSSEAQSFSEKQVDEAEKKAKKIREKDTNPPKSDTVIEANKNDINEQLQSVIDNIFVKLPEPRIVVDKAQTEEINAFTQCISSVVDTVYSDALLPDDYSAYHGVLGMFRARVKAQLVREFIKKVGYNSTFDLPTLDQLDTVDLYDVPAFVINQKKGMDNYKEQVANKINLGNRVENEGMVDTTGGDMSGGMGGDFGMGGAPGGDMGGMPGGSEAGGGFNNEGGDLGGLPDVGADMNMEGGNASSGTSTPAEQTGQNQEVSHPENGGMPNIPM